ncbi:ubiquitin-like protein 4A [Saccoglossus kowalevskii]|uniref:Ubiquitin-like protein 4A-like isoform X2 n=1 Tax=Saccoglossus kowalevskii TaxID=10224 RepID=A0ABM0MZC8_SACKO|nr:PREDICTED: ubiquitin-like protein 4A-like isoform X2 [Saccoglossus kowalevskii]
MLIYVKVLQSKGKECSIEVSSTDTVLFVKQCIAVQFNVPVLQQTLVFRGKTLADDQCLSYYDIEPDTKIHLVIKKCVTQLWDQLKPILRKHFKAGDMDKVIDHFKQEFENAMSSLSLDDLERISSYNLESRHSVKSGI